MPILALISQYKNIALLVAFLCVLGGFYIKGHHDGAVSQKADDQEMIDSVRAEIAENKRIANAELAKALNDVIATQVERDKFKTKLNQEYMKNVETTNRLAAAYSAYGLRFRSNIGCGEGGDNAVSGKGSATGNNGTAVIQLPEALARNLRQLALDADRLKDDYRLMYNHAHGSK